MSLINTVQTAQLSTDDEFDELRFGDGDESASITGFVESTVSPFRAGKKNDYLFKFILSNGNKRVTVLIWGSKLISNYVSEITSNRIIRINGGFNQLISSTRCKPNLNLIPCEIVVRENTSVSYLGHYQIDNDENSNIKEITFDDANQAQGLIMIKGYVRTPFSGTKNASGLSYGIGVITNGTHKITVQIKNFSAPTLEIGDSVTVKGTISKEEDIIKIYCLDTACIVYNNEEKPILADLALRGGRILRRKRQD